MTDRADVVVVGGGIAGLSAAHGLARVGRSTLTLEAAGEVGGRTRSRFLDGELAELGAEWVGPGHVHVMALVRELGLRVEPAGQLGHRVLWRGKGRARSGLLPALRPAEALAIARAMWEAARMARRIDPVEPWTSPAAAELDRQDFGGWLRRRGVGGDGLRFLDAFVGSLASRPADEVSLLHVLWWIRRGDGVLPTLRSTFRYRLREGTQAICRRLADRLGDTVRLGAAVASIEQSASEVRVETRDGHAVAAGRAIVTAPPGTLREIGFEPELPMGQQRVDELAIGAGVKVVALAPDERLGHRAVIGGEPLPVAWRAGRRLTGFAPPHHARASDEELIADLASCFRHGVDELRAPTVYRWSERPLISGCDLGFAPGDLTAVGPHLKAGHGRVLFAGAERGSWPNSMEGAVESAARAVAQVAAG